MQALVKPDRSPGAEVLQVPIPRLGPCDVLVRVKMASVCGTDLHIYEWDSWAQHRLHPPLTFGHEFCGVVEAAGSDVTTVAAGDLVSAEMHLACGKCVQCRSDQSHVCRNLRILGVDADGCFAEFVRIPESNIWKLDPRIRPEYAAVLDPLGNAVHTVLAGAIAGQSVAIVGCGPIGLMAIAVARACGAGPVVAIEPNPYRRRLAAAMKADLLLDPTHEDVLARVQSEMVAGGIPAGGVDVSLEFSGHPDGIRTSLAIARPGARVSLLGLPAKPLEIDLSEQVILKGLTVQGIHGRRMYETWFQMESLLRGDRLQLDPLFTDRLRLSDFATGMERLKRGEAGKVLLFPDGQQP